MWLGLADLVRAPDGGGAVLVALLLALAFESGLAVARGGTDWAWSLGRESAEAFLPAASRPTAWAAGWRNLPDDARVVGQDHRGFYLPRPYTMELAHRRRTGLGRHGESSGEVVAGSRAGFTHVLLCPPVPEDAVEFDPTLGRLLAPWLAGQATL